MSYQPPSLPGKPRPAARPYTPPTLMPTSPPALSPAPTPPVPMHHLQQDPSQAPYSSSPSTPRYMTDIDLPGMNMQPPMSAADRIRLYRETYQQMSPQQQRDDRPPPRPYFDATPPRYLR